jgi:hypothetical protein
MAFDWYLDNVRIMYWNKFNKPDFIFSRFEREGTGSIISYWWFDKDKEKKLKEAIKSDKELNDEPDEVNYWDKYKRNY